MSSKMTYSISLENTETASVSEEDIASDKTAADGENNDARTSDAMGTYIVRVVGRLDAETAPELDEGLANELGNAARLRFDFSELDYISSAGLRVLLAAHKRLSKEGSSVEVANATGAVLEVLEMSGFANIFTMV